MQNDSTVTIRLPKDLIESLDRIAEEDDITRSLLMRRMLLSEVGRRN